MNRYLSWKTLDDRLNKDISANDILVVNGISIVKTDSYLKNNLIVEMEDVCEYIPMLENLTLCE